MTNMKNVQICSPLLPRAFQSNKYDKDENVTNKLLSTLASVRIHKRENQIILQLCRPSKRKVK